MKRVPFHPLLIALFPVAYLYERNAAIVPVSEAVAAAAVVLAACATLFALFVWLYRDVHRAGIAASGSALLLLSYGRVFEFARGWSLGSLPVGRHELLLTVFVLACAGVVAAGSHVGAARRDVTVVLNTVGIVLVVLTVAPIVVDEVRADEPYRAEENVVGDAASGDVTELPDIYYLVPDRYAGAQTLRDMYGYDNASFLERLRSLGFFVADRALANYGHTSNSLAASLNLRYVDELSERYPDEPADRGPAYRMWERSEVISVLQERGYRFVYVTSSWDPTTLDERADDVYRFDPNSEFSKFLYETTILRPLAERLGVFEELTPSGSHRRNVLHQLGSLDAAARLPGPKFVFAHILLPHDPYVFEADGGSVTPEEAASRTLQENYVNHVRFANDRLGAFLERLLSGPAKDDPVVLLQADEGPHVTPRGRQVGVDASADPGRPFSWDDATDRELLEKFGILAAYHLPGGGEPEPYDTITPVNAFRLVFDRYLGTDLGLLPDRSYRIVDGYAYRFVDVTDRLRRYQR